MPLHCLTTNRLIYYRLPLPYYRLIYRNHHPHHHRPITDHSIQLRRPIFTNRQFRRFIINNSNNNNNISAGIPLCPTAIAADLP